MSTNYTTDNSHRSRGGRRRSRRGGSNRSNENNSRSSSNSSSSSRGSRDYSSRQPKKLTLWQKIVAFFTGGSKPASKPAARTSAPASKPAATTEPKAERKPRTGMRKPESVEVTSPRLYVGNLSFDASESDLFDLFNGVGIVQNVEVVSNRQTQRSKGFAFVQMQTVEEAKRAVSELHDKDYMGRKLVVSGAKAVERREEREERAPQEQPVQAQQPEQ